MYLKLFNVRWIWPTICLFTGSPGGERVFPAHLAEKGEGYRIDLGIQRVILSGKGERETQKIVKV